jgi:hypothetical protein
MMGWAFVLDTVQDMEGMTFILQITKAKEQESLQLFVVAYWMSTRKNCTTMSLTFSALCSSIGNGAGRY